MTDTVLIPFGSTGALALSPEEFKAALERGREFMGAPVERPVERVNGDEPLLCAEDASRAASVPKAWLLEAARQGRVPHYRLGKYVRFRASEIAESSRISGRRE